MAQVAGQEVIRRNDAYGGFARHSNGSRRYDAHLVLASIVQTSHASSIYVELDTILKPLLFIPIAPP